MNLFEYAIHPDAFKKFTDSTVHIHKSSWTNVTVTSSEQFAMLNESQYVDYKHDHITLMKDENEFRMFCLFVYYATTPEAFNQSEE